MKVRMPPTCLIYHPVTSRQSEKIMSCRTSLGLASVNSHVSFYIRPLFSQDHLSAHRARATRQAGQCFTEILSVLVLNPSIPNLTFNRRLA